MSPRPQLLTSDGDRLQTLICWFQRGRPQPARRPVRGRHPSPAATFLPSLQLVGHVLRQHGVQQGLVFFFSAAKCVERTRSSSSFLSSWLDSSISARRCWLRRMRSLVGLWGAMSERCIRRSSSSCRLRSLGEPQVQHAAQGLRPDHLAFRPGERWDKVAGHTAPDRHPHGPPCSHGSVTLLPSS